MTNRLPWGGTYGGGAQYASVQVAKTADPQDVRSEEALLGAILVSPAVAKKVSLDAGAFYKERHGKIWAAAHKCANNGGADPITVAAELERRGQLEEVGGRERLAQLAALTPAPGNAGAYAKRVLETAQLRKVRRQAQLLLEAVEKEDEPAIASALAALDRPVRYVDVSTGEVVDSCPTCEEKGKTIKKMQDQNTANLARISALEERAEKKAKEHKLWDEIEAAHTWWRLATGHFEVSFTTDDFRQALPRWKELGKGKANPIARFLKGVCGIAFDPSSKRGRAGRVIRYDSWELLTRSQAKFLEMCDRVPGDPDGEEWKKWLVAMIEAQFRETASS